jgi:hypothetical protein
MLLYGADAPLPARVPLRAGPLSLDYLAGDLRSIRLGAREIIRRIYVAVRDHNWGTVPATLSDEHVEVGEDSFTITYLAIHRRGPVHFRWDCRIAGGPDGTITFSMDGAAESVFRRNRIGICLLHPDGAAGDALRVEHVDGSSEGGVFPRTIAPHQPFLDIAALAHEAAPGCWVELRFAGDTFEMEDQRNWTDGSFKTYSTPLSLPLPVSVAPGDRVVQSVILSLRGALPSAEPAEPAAGRAVALTVEPGQGRALPAIGLGVARAGEPLTPAELGRLRALRPAHLRAELRLGDTGWPALLRRAAAEAAALAAPLELALIIGDAEGELAALAAELAALRPAVARWLVFSAGSATSDGAMVRRARAALAALTPGAAFGGGALASFVELNRGRPPAADLDVVAYAVTPQVHAFDLDSLAENLAPQLETLTSARALYPGLPIAVGPLTLRPQRNPAATGPEELPPAGELPPGVDPRQLSLFGAGWTLGSIAYLAAGGAASATFYETAGWRGVMERAEGSPLPERFPSTPGAVFPLYHVLAEVAEFAGGVALTVRSGDPLRVVALALEHGPRRRLIAANLTAEPQVARIIGFASPAWVRLLDAESAAAAGLEPERLRRPANGRRVSAEEHLALDLPPFAIAFVGW